MPYLKTDAGRAEIETRALRLPTALRSILLMVDGRRSEAELRELAGGLHAPADALEQLLALGLIEGGDRPAAAPASPAAAPAAVATAPAAAGDGHAYRRLYEQMSEAARHLGLKGYFLQLKIERCGQLHELRALLPELSEALRKARGEAFAQRWIAELEPSGTG